MKLRDNIGHALMIIRKQQMDSMEADARKNFEQFMRGHLAEFFPEHCRALRPEGVDRAIADGIERAGKYQIVSERDVCKFIDLQFAFGESFDTDPAHRWANEVLTDPEIQNPTTRIDVLMDRAQAYLAGLQGKGGAQ